MSQPQGQQIKKPEKQVQEETQQDSFIGKIQIQLGLIQGQNAAAGQAMEGGTKIAYTILLDLAYALFATAVMINISYNMKLKDDFLAYIEESQNRGFIITMAILGVIILALEKSYSQNTSYTPEHKKILNFIEDIFRCIVYVIMLAFVTRFVVEHNDDSLLIASYVIYIISGALFLAIIILKWQFYLCGKGAGNNNPWNALPIQQLQKMNPQQKKKTHASHQ